MAEMPVGYAANSITDREVENITRSGISTVITTPSDLHKNVEKQRHFDLMDVKKETPSPLLERQVDGDEDDSDHGSELYSQHMKGRVSPSPYTANTERARQFNAYVRSVIEDKLDTLIPISHQPRDLIQQIIMDAGAKFPEFATSVRKRIRTYLKSYRRSKRVKEMQAAAVAMSQQQHQYVTPSHRTANASNGLSSYSKENDSTPLINVASISLPTELTSEVSPPPAAVVTINANRHDDHNEPEYPPPKRTRLEQSPPVVTSKMVSPQNSNSSTSTNPAGGCGLSSNEAVTLQQLIQGYRESAAFLTRAADQLEEMLLKDNML